MRKIRRDKIVGRKDSGCVLNIKCLFLLEIVAGRVETGEGSRGSRK